MLRTIRTLVRLIALALLVLSATTAHGQTTAFTYQGQLSDAGAPASGDYDLRFALFDSAAGGAQIGANQTVPAVPVSEGVFTVQFDFGVNAFPGADRFVEIGVRPAGHGSFTTLAPRQQISSTPYAIRTLSAATADALSGTCTGCVQDTQIQSVAGSKVSGTIPVASVPASNGNYIQNTTTQQASSNFNISGNGTVGSLNANGAVSLGGISPPGAAPAGQGRVYFDTASNKVKVSENGSAFVNLVGASGVSGSGTTNSIPFWSAATTLGNSQITQSANGVQLPNGVQLAVGQQGNQVSFGSPSGETGMSIAGFSGRADLRFDGTLKLVAGLGGVGPPPSTNGIAITLAGNVGIGTTNPAAKLHVEGGTPVTPSAGGFVQLGSSTGTNVAIDDDEIMARFNGAPTKLYINYEGDDVVFGGAIDIGYQIVTGQFDVVCPPGKKVLGGGCNIDGGNRDLHESYPVNNGWHCDAGVDHDILTEQYDLTAYAICARVK